MNMIGGEKKSRSMIGGSADRDEEEPESNDNGLDAKSEAIGELFEAFEQGNKKRARAALEAFVYACSSED